MCEQMSSRDLADLLTTVLWSTNYYYCFPWILCLDVLELSSARGNFPASNFELGQSLTRDSIFNVKNVIVTAHEKWSLNIELFGFHNHR